MDEQSNDRDDEFQKESGEAQEGIRPDEGPRDELIALVEGSKRGDKDSFGQIFLLFKGRVYRHLLKYVRDRETAADLSQDVFFKAWRSIASLERAMGVERWLLMIATHMAIDYLRRLQLERRHQLTLDVEERDYIDERTDTEREVVDKEIVRKAFAELRPRLQKMLLLSIIGYSAAEIATFCQCKTPGVVATLLSKARKLLREKISTYLATKDAGARKE